MKAKRFSPALAIGAALALLLLMVALAVRPNGGDGWLPRARPDDRSPLGGRALSLLLERAGLRVAIQSEPLRAMPGAKLWILLDPGTQFSPDEANMLLNWVRAGNTLIWADASSGDRARLLDEPSRAPFLEILRRASGVGYSYGPFFRAKAGLPLPPLAALSPAAASIYRTGVSRASASGDSRTIEAAHLEIMGDSRGSQLSRIDIGKGRIFVTPDALGFTNMALASDDNATLAMNIVRAHTGRGDLVVWDERTQEAPGQPARVTPGLLYFLWQPPLRWATLQVLGAGVLLALFWGRRLGRPVPLTSPPNALRASQWALAMSALFQKVERPHVAAQTSGEHFRRALARRVGLSPGESDEVLARRAAQAADLDARAIDELLLRARTPSKVPAEMLRDIQQMELVLQKLRGQN